MDNIFNSVLLPKPNVSRFDLSHDVKMSFNMGELVPSFVMECLPGDVVSISVENMLRFAPLVSPVMHRINVTTHFYFVPNRLLWENWEDFITGNEDVAHPFVTVSGSRFPVGSLADYLAFPNMNVDAPGIPVSPLPVAAYYKIWDEYYRDQNLQTELFIPLSDGNNTANYLSFFNEPPLRRAWMHDYFTSALPFAQKGDAVQIPLTFQDNIPVQLDYSGNKRQLVRDPDTGLLSPVDQLLENQAGPTPYSSSLHTADGSEAVIDPNGTYIVDVQSDATTINDLRRALALQKYLEINARAGTRYTEFLKAHFNVNSSDARLQRPEYIGGAYQRMTISEVLATATAINPDTGEAIIPQGNMAGHGISVGGGQRFTYRCEEHGWILGIINVQPVTAYQQGLHRSYTRFDRFDYFTPSFEHIGEQAVLSKEVYASAGDATSLNETFGYVPRYAEYKYMNSRVAGEMKDSLLYWHLGRVFSTTPQLNEEFISCVDDNTLNRIFAVTDPDVDHIYAHIFNNVSAVRKMSKYSVPAGL